MFSSHKNRDITNGGVIMAAAQSFNKELAQEIDERLALMEEPGYEFPKALNRLDWTLIIVIPIVSLILLIIGEFL